MPRVYQHRTEKVLQFGRSDSTCIDGTPLAASAAAPSVWSVSGAYRAPSSGGDVFHIALPSEAAFGTLEGMNAYFDTSVYSRLEKKLVPYDEAEALTAAVRRGEINVYFGMPDAEELFGQWDNTLSRSTARCRLQIAASLTRGFKYVLKSPNDLLGEAIRAYAEGLPEPSPMVSALTSLQATALLRWAANGSADNDHVDALIADMLATSRCKTDGAHPRFSRGAPSRPWQNAQFP
jgi:hypothetical protein